MYTSIVTIYVGGGGAVAFLFIFKKNIFHSKSGVFKIHGFSYFYIRVQPLTSELEF